MRVSVFTYMHVYIALRATGGCASAFFCAESAPTTHDLSVFVGADDHIRP